MNLREYVIGIIMTSDIPREVLELTFGNKNANDSMLSLEYKIDSRALTPRFFLDINVISGVELEIPLNDCEIVSSNDGVTLVIIPDSILLGRGLISVLSIMEEPISSIQGDSSISGMISNISFDGYRPAFTARLEKLSGNEFIVYKDTSLLHNAKVKVLVEYSNRFSEINPKFNPSLSLTALECVKAYIYKEMVVKAGEAHLHHGYELQVINNHINDYAGSFKEYMRLIQTITKKQLYMADAKRMKNYMSMTFGARN